MWLTVNYLGDPDNGVIFASYLGSFLMAGGYLAIGSAISAATNNQVIAFVVSVVVCFLFTISGYSLVMDFVSTIVPWPAVIEEISRFSFLARFNSITDGVIDLRDIFYFLTLIAAWLFATGVVIDTQKAG
jgi:ABC-2 type transport system permease protein